MRFKLVLVLLCLAGSLLFSWSFTSQGYDVTWKLLSVRPMQPHFADLRVILAGLQSQEDGLDPLSNNPHDPWNRTMNYPRLWMSLGYLGLGSGDIFWLGFLMAAAFFVSVLLFLPNKLNLVGQIAVILTLTSPAVFFAVERANIDLIIFVVLSLGVVALRQNQWKMDLTGLGLILLAFILKLFPIFACGALVKSGRNGLLICAALSIGVVLTYVLLTYQDLLLISAGTPRAPFASYGISIAGQVTSSIHPAFGHIVTYLSYGLAVVSLLAALVSLYYKSSPPLETQADSIDAYRMGAFLFLGCFLIGNNWNYRLLFLLLTVPQLACWTTHAGPWISRLAWLCLLSALGCLWQEAYRNLLYDLTGYRLVAAMLYQALSWSLFLSLLTLLTLSLPAWLGEEIRRLVSQRAA